MTPELRRLLVGGEALFRSHRFHEAHEEWEAAWRVATGGTRELFQGLVQVAAACHHLQSGRTRQARTLLGRARRHLLLAAGAVGAVDVSSLLTEMEELDAWLADGGPGGEPPWPRIHISGPQVS